MLKRANFRLTVLFGIIIALNLCIQETQGLKCYYCGNCPDPLNEVECELDFEKKPGFCYLTEVINGTKNRGCSYAHEKDFDEKLGIKCNEFTTSEHNETFKRCYCDKDLCNGSGTERGRYHILIVICLYATVYQGKMIN